MPDTKRTLSALQTLLESGFEGNISAQDVRDFLVSVFDDVGYGSGNAVTAAQLKILVDGIINSNYILEGYSTGRNVLRVLKCTIMGLTDITQLTLEVEDIYNSEVLAIETVDTDNPTGGTRFDISANGQNATIKGFSQNVVGVFVPSIIYNNTGTSYVLNTDVISNNIKFTISGAASGVTLDMSGIANGVGIQFKVIYITSS